MTDWTGDERRAIQTHVLNWVEERLTTHVNKVEKLFSDHTDDEMERYKEILDLIERNNKENRDRHEVLSASINTYMDKSEKVYAALTDAFVLTPKGEPDFHGHARAHESWIDERKEQKEFMAYIKKVVSAAIATALVMWLGVLVWQGVLAGPKG